MAKKMDGVKISVSNDLEEETPKKKVKKQVKTPAKAPAKKPKKAAVTKSIAQKKEKSGVKKLLSTLITVAVACVIVGGGIYLWQEKIKDKSLSEVSKDARTARIEFEKRIENLKNKITGVETENLELKKLKEELEEKVSYLDGATKVYINEEPNFSFLYPATFGEVVVKVEEGKTGDKIQGSFTENEKLVFGGVSEDYSVKATATKISFLETQGFSEKRKKYYFQPYGDETTDYEINPAKIINLNKNEGLVVDKKSFVEVENDEDKIKIDIGENIGALINLGGEKYKGLAFINSDFGMMNLEDFESMISTIEIK